MANINAALGLSQIENLKYFLQKKKKIRSFYEKKLKNIKGISMVNHPKNHDNNFWLNIIYFNKSIKKNVYDIHLYLLKNKIDTRMIWFPCHLQKKMKMFQNFNIKSTKNYFDRCLCLPSGTSLTIKNLNKIVHYLCKI